MKNWSAEQELIREWFRNGVGHLLVRARAGCGKTTIIMEGVSLAPEANILIAAFSKIIQIELEKRLKLIKRRGITAKTLHAAGLACISRFRNGIKIQFDSTRADEITAAVCGVNVPSDVMRLVTKLHTKGREIAPHARVLGDLTEVQVQFDCMPDDSWANSGFPPERVEELALAAMEYASQIKDGGIIDGSDMIFLPVRNRWLAPLYDMVVVDEAQDMTPAQLEIATGILKPGGRMAIVGDDRQGIFAFRGADSGALDRLKNELGAAELGLKTTYRCGKLIVDRAQEFVPDFCAAETNHVGDVWEAYDSELVELAQGGDFILSRTNAPMIGIAMKLLRAGKRTKIAGKDLDKELLGIIRKTRAKNIDDFKRRLLTLEEKKLTDLRILLEKAEVGRKKQIERKMDDVRDQTAVLLEISEGARSMPELENRIISLFKDDGLGEKGIITCSSVHRAKGLEADRVFVLDYTLRRGDLEEENINYVAITRAKNELVYVSRDYM